MLVHVKEEPEINCVLLCNRGVITVYLLSNKDETNSGCFLENITKTYTIPSFLAMKNLFINESPGECLLS